MGKLKRTTACVAEYFKEQGCELLDEYHGCQEPMDYKCSCGEFGTTNWNNFSRGKRCGHCTKWGNSKKRSLEQVRQIFADRGAVFLDDEFRGIHYNHRYRCKCGNEGEISFAGFHHQNQDCKKCGLEKIKGKKHPQWKPDREQHRLDMLFRKKCYKALSSSLKATNKEKVGRTSDMLGYKPKQLQAHIEKHPDWNELKDGSWHLDHIFPIQAFIEHEIKDLSIINHLDNLRPTTQFENSSKHAKYDRDQFYKWLKQHGVSVSDK